MTQESAHRIDTLRFAHELVDDEVVIIDMDGGNYYSLRGSAVAVWQLLDQGHGLEAMVRVLADAYAAPPADVRAALDAFLSELETEGILTPADGAGNPDSPDLSFPNVKGEFAPPRVEKFTDMQDLLTLDPIHEVDESGWPHLKPPENGN